MANLKVGVSKRCVTPPIWVPYLTSSGNGTCAPFDGVHDDLFARAMVFDNGDASLAILAVDAIGYDNAVLGSGRNFTSEVRHRIARATGLTADAIMLSSTHAHSTPETICLTPFRETPGVADWLEAHVIDLANTVIDAWHKRESAHIWFGTVPVSGVARNRRVMLKDGSMNRHGPLPDGAEIADGVMDEDLAVVYVENAAEKSIGVLLNYTAHPVITMLLPPVSADFPGAATACVEAALDGAVFLFTNGAAGNINSMCVTTSFDDAQKMGEVLGQAALHLIDRLKADGPIEDVALGVQSQVIVLDGCVCPDLEEAEAMVAQNPSPGHLRMLRLACKLAEGPIEAEVQVMHVGSIFWVSVPGEGFVETGLALKASGASFVVGYANGWVGYLPIPAAYDQGGYEVGPGVWSRVAHGSAERVEGVGKALLNRVYFK